MSSEARRAAAAVGHRRRKAAEAAVVLVVVALCLSGAGWITSPVAQAQSSASFEVTRQGDVYTAASEGVTYAGTLKSVVERAVENLDASGEGTVRFGAGTFDLGIDFFLLRGIEDIVFEGQGIDVTIIRNQSDASADTEPFNADSVDRLTIRDLTVLALGTYRFTSDAMDFDDGNDLVIERVKIGASRSRGIVFDGKGSGDTADRNVVRDCVITGTLSSGIELLASSHNRIEGCKISDVGGHGIRITKSSSVAAQPHKQSNDNVVTGNVIDNSAQDGINVNSGDRNEISGNTVTNSSDDTSSGVGIRITSTDSVACDDNVIQDNRATDTQAIKTQKYGLYITGPNCHGTVVGPNNDFSGNRAAGINDQGSDTIYLESVPPPPPPPPPPPAPEPQPQPQPDPGFETASGKSGYWMVTAAGNVFNFGNAQHFGNGVQGSVDIEPTRTGDGYWILTSRGEVFTKGAARYLGGAPVGAGEKAVSLSATPSGNGYWIFTDKGRVIAFGDAPYKGDMSRVVLNGPVLDSVATPSGQGYYMVASDGGIFTFGDAKFYGSMGGKPLNQPVMSMAPDPDGVGYWLVASDGGVFAFDAKFYGSMGSTRLNKPISGMVTGPAGYLMVAEDGGIFTFGDVRFHGSLGSNPPASPVVAVALLS